MFNFGNTAGASQSTSKSRLKGNEIHTVKFKECEIQDIQGKKDATQIYKVIKLKFENEDGYFEHTIFEPKPEGGVRKDSSFTNKNGNVEKIPQASNNEAMMLLLKHTIDAFVPEVAKKIDERTQTLGAKDWEGLRTLVKAILDKGIGVESKIKLLKNKEGDAQFPGFFCGINKEGKAYIRNNFIGNKVAFSPYEMDRIKKEASATPNKIS